MLTKRQHDLLIFIHRSTQITGVGPSYHEMMVALGMKSKSGIHRMVVALEERGFIRRLPNHARAIEVLRMPDGSASVEALLRENARLVMALLRARDTLVIYEPHPKTALIEVRAALPRWARDDHVH